MAVELEFLNRGDEAILSYDKAKSIFTRELNCQLPFQSVQPYLVKMPFVDGMIKQKIKSSKGSPKRKRLPSAKKQMSKVLDSRVNKAHIPQPAASFAKSSLQTYLAESTPAIGRNETTAFAEWNF